LVVSEVVKYYQAGGQRIALRKNGAVSYLFGDHLGSTSVTADATGVRMAELWYKPWGENRGTPVGATPTTYRFTGQREDASIGLYFYNARYYDPALGRFISADTLVPQPQNPQSLNRYSYALNNSVRFSDPTGMFSEDQMISWYGKQWRSLFSEAWQAILLEAELGDVLASGVDDATMFVLNELGGLAGWYIPNAGLSSAISIGDWVGKTDAASSALYRPTYAGAGPTHGYAETGIWLEFQHGNNRYQRIGGRYSAAATLTLPAEWYRGQSQHVQLHAYFAGLDLGLGDIADLGLEAFAVGIATWGARQAGVKAIATAGVAAVGGVAGVAVLAINLAEWVTFDTSYDIAYGQGTPLPRPVPEPYHR
ncbi:MAG: RHS repeat-associated core domain-containing protein, partial [Anaerolineae bacterium]